MEKQLSLTDIFTITSMMNVDKFYQKILCFLILNYFKIRVRILFKDETKNESIIVDYNNFQLYKIHIMWARELLKSKLDFGVKIFIALVAHIL